MDHRTTYPLTGVRRATTEPQRALIERAYEVLEADARILAGWLVGSFAVGFADAYSDVDLQCLIRADAVEDLKASWRDVIHQITPSVRITPFPGTIGGSCITPEWHHLDLVMYEEATLQHFERGLGVSAV